jgi:hypothetical protein
MAYFSLNEDFQRLGSSCGGRCQCGPCRQGQAGRAALAEWYERDEDEPEAPTTATKAVAPQPAIGELPPPRMVLQPPRLLQPDPMPPLVRRMQGVLTRGLPPLTLRPPFQPTPPPRPPDLFRLSPEFQRGLIEKWERERRSRELFSPPPPPPQRITLQEAIDRYLDNNLNRLMSGLGIPPGLRDPIRKAARAAIGRGAEELLDRSLTQMRLSSEAKEAIGASVRAAMRQIRVR